MKPFLRGLGAVSLSMCLIVAVGCGGGQTTKKAPPAYPNEKGSGAPAPDKGGPETKANPADKATEKPGDKAPTPPEKK